MTIENIKKELKLHIGDTVTIKYNLGRNKYEKYDAVLKQLYNHIFLVEIDEVTVRSFSYTDVITKTIKIDY